MKIALILIVAFANCKAEDTPECTSTLQDQLDTCADGYINTVKGFFYTMPQDIGIDLRGMNKEILNDMCNNKEKIEKYYRCVYREINACIPSEMNRIMLPNVDSVIASISYLCDNAEDVKFAAMQCNAREDQCMIASSEIPPPDTTNIFSDSNIKYSCRVQDTRVLCTEKAMSECDEKTADIIAKFNEYFKTASCDATMTRISLGLLVISLCCSWFRKMIW